MRAFVCVRTFLRRDCGIDGHVWIRERWPKSNLVS